MHLTLHVHNLINLLCFNFVHVDLFKLQDISTKEDVSHHVDKLNEIEKDRGSLLLEIDSLNLIIEELKKVCIVFNCSYNYD